MNEASFLNLLLLFKIWQDFGEIMLMVGGFENREFAEWLLFGEMDAAQKNNVFNYFCIKEWRAMSHSENSNCEDKKSLRFITKSEVSKSSAS